jgi:hypothetical protein
MNAYKAASGSGDDLPDALRDPLPPVTRRLLGIARGANEGDYKRYLDEKYTGEGPGGAKLNAV